VRGGCGTVERIEFVAGPRASDALLYRECCGVALVIDSRNEIGESAA